MSKRSVFTTVTPLPAGVSRQVVLDFLHDHEEMIDLNPLVKERHPIPTPPHAPADEQDCRWYSLTDKISYLPGGLVTGDVTYTCAFHDLPTGLQTHCYAPAGLTIRDKWTVGGSLPNEPPQPVELGLNAPPTGLYLREDVDMRCNVIMTSFVKKTLKKSHAALVDRLKIQAEIASSNRSSGSVASSGSKSLSTPRSIESGRTTSSSGYHASSVSAASSVASTTSSPSCYTAQSSPMWSPAAASSLGTTPSLSAKSPPTAYTRFQHQHQPVPHSRFISETPFLQQPTTNLDESAPVLDAPVIRRGRPNWPLETPSSSASASATAPRPREENQLYKHASDHAAAQQRSPMPQGAHGLAISGKSTLPDDALWQALGGGRFAVHNGATYRSNADTRAVDLDRTRHRNESHPDYPQMSPYDDEQEARFSVLPLAARGIRREGVPPPLRPQPPPGATVAATLHGPFIAELY